MKRSFLGYSDIEISKICLGTMTFGNQVSIADSINILDFSFNHGINFFDTAEMYPVPQSAVNFGFSEKILGEWISKNPNRRKDIVISTKISGNSRGLNWIRNGEEVKPEDFERSCNESLKRLRTDYIDLYQIHWPLRNAPMFGEIYFDPEKNVSNSLSILAQIQAVSRLISSGKIRAFGLSNETPFGICEFIRIADSYNLPRPISVQNSYCLLNRTVENALDECLYHYKISLLAYSPLAYGLLTGKYDLSGFTGPLAPANSRITKFESVRKQRWGRESALNTAKLYNEYSKLIGLSPVQLALAFCLNKWQVSSVVMGVTSIDQLSENLTSINIKLDSSMMNQLDTIRLYHRDPVA